LLTQKRSFQGLIKKKDTLLLHIGKLKGNFSKKGNSFVPKTIFLKKIVTVFLSFTVLLLTLAFTSLAQPTDNLSIHFNHFVGNTPLSLDTVQYKNELGQPFTITKFKYYISNIHLRKTDGSLVSIDKYFLINEDEPDSKNITLTDIPTTQFTGLDFIIGVDSLHNCSGAQSGALDPVNAMFWAWNTGYIFLKLEGKAAASKSPGHVYEYHIGGYQQPANCIRKVSLNFPRPLTIGTDKEIELKVDAAEILKTPNTIDFSKLSSVTDFHNATTIADNYVDMFSILSVK
jgi:hypothetical protein